MRCPDCGGALRGTPPDLVCERLRAPVRGERRLPRPAPRRQLRRADEVPRRGAARRRAARARVAAAARGPHPQRHAARRSSRPGPTTRVVDLGCGSGRTLVWNADLRRLPGRHRREPVLRPRGLRAAPTSCSATCAGCRSRTARSPRPPRSTCSSTCRGRRCADVLAEASRVLAPGGALFVYSHVRRNSRLAGGLKQINRLARWLERRGPGRPVARAPAQVGSPEPARGHPRSRAQVATRRGSASSRIRYYTPLIGGFVENILLRIGEHWLARRAAPARRGGRAGRSTANDAAREARATAKRRVREPRRRVPRPAAGHVGDEARPAALRARAVRPVLRAAGSGRRRERPLDEHPLRGPRPARARHDGRDRSTWRRWPRAWPRSAHEVHVLTAPGRRAVSRRRRPAGTRWRRRSDLRTCASAAVGRGARRSRATAERRRRHRALPQLRRRRRPGRARCRRRRRARSERAGHRLPGLAEGAGSTGSSLVEPMRRWRDAAVPDGRPDRHADGRRSCRLGRAARSHPRDRMGRRHGVDSRRGRGAGAVRPAPRATVVAVFAGAFRPWHGAVAARAGLAPAPRGGAPRHRRGAHRRWPRAGAAEGRVRGLDGVTFTGRSRARPTMPACLAAADIGVAPFDVAAHPPLQLAFYWSPLKVFEYMAAGLPVVAPAIPGSPGSGRPGHEGLLYDPQAPRGLADALARLASRRRTSGGVSARRSARGSCRTSAGRRTARKLDEAIRPLRAAAELAHDAVLIATDAFPPVCGGSGWSTYELARGLRERGHEVTIVQPHAGITRRIATGPTTVSTSARSGRPAPRRAVRPQLLQERAALAPGRVRAARDRPRDRGRRHPRPARADGAGGGGGGRQPRDARGVHGPRLLARLLLGHAHPRPGVRDAVPGLHAAHDARGASGRARAPRGRPTLPFMPYMRANLARKQQRPREGRRGGRRQLDDRAGPARARAGAGGGPHRDHSEPRRHRRAAPRRARPPPRR